MQLIEIQKKMFTINSCEVQETSWNDPEIKDRLYHVISQLISFNLRQSMLGEIQWKKSKISGNFEQKISSRSFFSFSFLSQSRPSRLHYTAFWVTTDQCKILNFSTKSWSVWTKNFLVVSKNGPPRAAGRKLCKMGAGRPEVILSAVKCLASSGAFEKFTKF